jgi:hypothetical protein
MTKKELFEIPSYQIMEWIKECFNLTEADQEMLDGLDDDDLRIYVRDNFLT